MGCACGREDEARKRTPKESQLLFASAIATMPGTSDPLTAENLRTRNNFHDVGNFNNSSSDLGDFTPGVSGGSVLLPDAGHGDHVPALPAEEASSCAQCNVADAADLKYRTTSTDLVDLAPPAATTLLLTPSRIADTTTTTSPHRPAEASDDITGVTKPPLSPSMKPTPPADRSSGSSGSVGKAPADRSCDSFGLVCRKPSGSGEPAFLRDGPLPPRFHDSGSDSRSTLDSPRSSRSEDSVISFGNFSSEGTLSNSGLLPFPAEAASKSSDDACGKSPHSGGVMARFHSSRPSGAEGMHQAVKHARFGDSGAARTPRAANDDNVDVSAEGIHASTASSIPSVPSTSSTEVLPHTQQQPEAVDCEYSI